MQGREGRVHSFPILPFENLSTIPKFCFFFCNTKQRGESKETAEIVLICIRQTYIIQRIFYGANLYILHITKHKIRFNLDLFQGLHFTIKVSGCMGFKWDIVCSLSSI